MSIEDKFHIGIISHARPKNVPAMEKICYPFKITWYVGDGEYGDYKMFGATSIFESGNLIDSRNAVIEDACAKKKYAIEISDDLKRINWLNGALEKEETNLEFILNRVLNYFEEDDKLFLQGVSPTDNPFFAKKFGSNDSFIVGDMLAVRPSSLRFDPLACLKEDYDFTLQHLHEGLGILRHNDFLCSFAHTTNKGGAVEYRDSESEQKVIRYLKEKWPGCIRDNPRRVNQILMKFKKQNKTLLLKNEKAI